ncbi:hypothetical protein GGX14DRAFT_648169 [Mycena pura]|uniref:FAD-binding PCMH-type domain-containing protein n=1 Tax=Mycena pura TaxID=153505 RepID=A0AAD6V6Z7_9AGAR|nr:hypothetical protein GGX14DRAFT_648169 [Mycena pura]
MEVPGIRSSSGEHAPPPILQRDHILQEILTHIDVLQKREPRLKDIDTKPLKEEVLAPLLRNELDTEVQIRGFLRMLQYTAGFKESLEKIGRPDLKEQIASNKHGVVGKGHESIVVELPNIYEDQAQTRVMEVHSNDEFVNWGETVKNTPIYTFVPTTVLGIQNLVRYASAHNLRVRCSGFRHSWSPIFSQSSEILISFVDLTEVTTLPDPMSLLPGDYTGTNVPELKTIELKEQTSSTKRLCCIGAAVTNEDFRRWAVANNAWALPVSVIMAPNPRTYCLQIDLEGQLIR